MSEPTTIPDAEPAPSRWGGTTPRFRIIAAAVIVVAVGLIGWLVLRDDSSTSSTPSDVTAVSPGQVKELATSVGHPVFWLGPKDGYTYELKRTQDGSIFIRYLPEGVELGAKEGYLTVGTYPFPGAFAAIRAIAKQSGTTAFKLPHRGLGEVKNDKPSNIHAAYPGVDYQVEIFDPVGKAVALAKKHLAAFGSLKDTSAAPKPKAASVAQLKALAKSVDHPVYWVGPRKGYTYELTKRADGQITIRYLPPGDKVGASGEFLSVATYPFPNAFGTIEALTKQPNAVVINVPGGGAAVAEPVYRKNIHLAYPGSDYQLEVFAPTSAAARRIVSSGQVKSIG